MRTACFAHCRVVPCSVIFAPTHRPYSGGGDRAEARHRLKLVHQRPAKLPKVKRSRVREARRTPPSLSELLLLLS